MTFLHLPAVAEEVKPLAERFDAVGHRAYLVGGVVRDLWLDREPGEGIDLDLTTDADPATIKRIVDPVADALWLQGERFGTTGARIAGRDYEITTHRSEAYTPDSRKPDVAFATAVETDLSRRDFTVNAMAIRVPSLELIDPFGGADDLATARLATPLDPEISFVDDPLRMMRAARFAAGYALTPAPELVAAMEAFGERLDIVSAERIREELDKLLVLPEPGPGMALLERTGLLGRIAPEIAAATLEVRSRAVVGLAGRADIRLCAYLFGADVEAVRGRLSALRYSNDRRRDTIGTLIAAEQLVSGDVDHDPFVRRWVAAAGAVSDDAVALVAALVDDGLALAERFRARAVEMHDDLADLDGPLSGSEVIEVLGVDQGPDIGRALAHLQELRFELGPMSPADAKSHLDRWWATNGQR